MVRCCRLRQKAPPPPTTGWKGPSRCNTATSTIVSWISPFSWAKYGFRKLVTDPISNIAGRATRSMLNEVTRAEPPQLSRLFVAYEQAIGKWNQDIYDEQDLAQLIHLIETCASSANELLGSDSGAFQRESGTCLTSLAAIRNAFREEEPLRNIKSAYHQQSQALANYGVYLSKLCDGKRGAIAKVTGLATRTLQHQTDAILAKSRAQLESMTGKPLTRNRPIVRRIPDQGAGAGVAAGGEAQLVEERVSPLQSLFNAFMSLPKTATDISFFWIRGSLIKLLESIPDRVDIAHKIGVSHAIKRAVSELNGMKSFDYSQVKLIYERLAESHFVIDGVIEIPRGIREDAAHQKLKELLSIAISIQSSPDASASFSNWFAKNGLPDRITQLLYGEGASLTHSNQLLIKEIGAALTKLDDCIQANEGVYHAAVNLECALLLVPGLGNGETPAQRRAREAFGAPRDAGQTINSRRDISRENFLADSALFCTFQFIEWMAPLRNSEGKPIDIDAEHQRLVQGIDASLQRDAFLTAYNGLMDEKKPAYGGKSLRELQALSPHNQMETAGRDIRVGYQNAMAQISARTDLSRWRKIFLRLAIPVAHRFILWGTRHYSEKAERLSQKLANTLVGGESKSLKPGPFGRAQGFFGNVTQAIATMCQSPKKTAGMTAARKERLSHIQKRGKIAGRVIRIITTELMPEIPIKAMFTYASNRLKKWADPIEGHYSISRHFLSGVGRFGLYIVRVVLTIPNWMTNRIAQGVARLAIKQLGLMPRLIDSAIGGLTQNLSRFDIAAETIIQLIKQRAQELKASDSELGKKGQANPMSMIRNTEVEQAIEGCYIDMMKALHAFENGRSLVTPYDPTSAPKAPIKIPGLSDNTLYQLIIHNLVMIFADIDIIGEGDIHSLEKVIEELVYSSASKGLRGYGELDPESIRVQSSSYRGRSLGYERAMNGALSLLYKNVSSRVIDDLGKGSQSVVDEYITWLTKQVNGGEVASFLPTLIGMLVAANGRVINREQLIKLQKVQSRWKQFYEVELADQHGAITESSDIGKRTRDDLKKMKRELDIPCALFDRVLEEKIEATTTVLEMNAWTELDLQITKITRHANAIYNKIVSSFYNSDELFTTDFSQLTAATRRFNLTITSWLEACTLNHGKLSRPAAVLQQRLKQVQIELANYEEPIMRLYQLTQTQKYLQRQLATLGSKKDNSSEYRNLKLTISQWVQTNTPKELRGNLLEKLNDYFDSLEAAKYTQLMNTINELTSQYQHSIEHSSSETQFRGAIEEYEQQAKAALNLYQSIKIEDICAKVGAIAQVARECLVPFKRIQIDVIQSSGILDLSEPLFKRAIKPLLERLVNFGLDGTILEGALYAIADRATEGK